MAISRYWRLVALESYTGAGIALSECHLFNNTGRVDVGASLTSTTPPAYGTLDALQDDDLATVCVFTERAVSASGFAITWALGTEESVSAVRLGSTTRASFLRSATLQYFDGTSWQTHAVFDSFLFPGDVSLATSPVGADIYYPLVPLLLHFDGTAGSTVIVDSSVVPHTVSANGVTLSAVQSKFGGTSGAFSGGDTVTLAAAPEFALPGDFTFESWVYLKAIKPFPSYQTIFNIGTFSTGLMCRINATGLEAYILGVGYTWPAAITTGQWYHMVWVRQQGSVSAWLNGVLLGGAVAMTGLIPALPVTIGTSAHAPGEFIDGYVDELRLTRGVPRYSSSFSVPTAPFPDFLSITEAPVLRVTDVGPELFASAGSDEFSVVIRPVTSWRDMYFDGDGFIAGTVKRDSDPVDIPLKRRVRLHREHDGLPVRETWSDPVTGAYSFPQISRDFVYTVVAYDYEHNYRAVIADNIVPEVMT